MDAAVAESADGRIPWARFKTLVEAEVVAAAPEVARAEEEQARRARFAKTCADQRHGMGSFLIRADIATITRIDAVITSVAAALKTAMPEAGVDERRLRAIMVLLHHQVAGDSPARDATPDRQDARADTPPWGRDVTVTESGAQPADDGVAGGGRARWDRPPT